MPIPPLTLDVQNVLTGALGDYLGGLASSVTLQLLGIAGHAVRKRYRKDPEVKALEMAIKEALAVTFVDLADDPELFKHFTDIFEQWLRLDDVRGEFSSLIDPRPESALDMVVLEEEFEEAGFDVDWLGPQISFAAIVPRFAAAFYDGACRQPRLQPVIEIQLLRGLVERVSAVGAETARAADAAEGIQALVQRQQDQPEAMAHYLRSLIHRCESMELPDSDEVIVSGKEGGVQVSDVFTTLYLTRSGQIVTRRPDETVKEALQEKREVEIEAEPRSKKEEEEGVPVPAVAAVGALDRLVVLGYPGGGKSTLVNYISTRLARRREGEQVELEGWEDGASLLPVRIILRRFATWLPAKPPADKAGLVWQYIEKQLKDMGCPDAFPVVRRILREEGGVVFFDGLDEVRETDIDQKRTLIKEAIEAFSGSLETCRIVVTCREYAYKQGDQWELAPGRFPVVDLALFEMPQIGSFVQTWYQVVGPGKGWSAEKIDEEAGKLARAIEQMPHLYELAQYPLLLTLMAQVHGKDGTLPEDRADLYGRAVDLLLAHWESRVERESGFEIKPGLIAQLGVRRELLKSALARVAFRAHERQELAEDRDEQAADIPREELREVLAGELGSYDKAIQVTDYIQDRAGLLQARDTYTYSFPHRSFQEFLAASYIWEMQEPETQFKVRVRRDLLWWREVFLLAAGMQREKPASISNLVDTLVPSLNKQMLEVGPVEWSMLAAQALHDTGFIRFVAREVDDPFEDRFTQTLQRVQRWLLAGLTAEDLINPVRRAEFGMMLGKMTQADGSPLDNRPGVGYLRRGGIKVPDIAWGEIVPADSYFVGGDGREYNSFKKKGVVIERPFQLARYPITYVQFQCFVDASDFDDHAWWDDMPPDRGIRQMGEQSFKYWNHPRVNVSWYQAIAFCRWLSHKMGYDVDLPHEHEWETAARFPDGRYYPWGNEFSNDLANTSELVGRTSAVGMYPGGANPNLDLYDQAGNVWEWCLNKYEEPDNKVRSAVDDSQARRVLRGGSWYYGQYNARAAFRDSHHPDFRASYYGFRVVRRPPSE